ncbi:MAG: type I-U CRISPR-associated RAMP protein Csb1/Cas7u [Gammaproteobacteria bacterium]|nr:type I-U CRISPR-associated RAMP protein Csb1/Cas7u [Gammaproteobacteria bacterium]
MNNSISFTPDTINTWADDVDGPVALHLKQKLLAVGEDNIIFPPTYADIGYNIDTLSDGTKVALIDSVGSQANRMEPIFKSEPYSELVPQIEIELHTKENDGEKHIEKRSLLDLAHRSADAVVYSCPELVPSMEKAFRELRQSGDAAPLCLLAPTSLVFGFWDSRGASGEKHPRLVRSTIRAWNVEPLHAAAQFNSVWKALDDDQKDSLEKEAKAKKTKLSEKGFADAPATFRKTKVAQYVDSSPNLEARVLGGVLTSGPIERNITVNLVALRALNGANDEETKSVRRYLLALTLIAATAEIDLFLREGCHLRYADDDVWGAIPRRGAIEPIDLSSDSAQKSLLDYAKEATEPFRKQWPTELIYKFNLNKAKKLLAKKSEDEESPA